MAVINKRRQYDKLQKIHFLIYLFDAWIYRALNVFLIDLR